MAEPALAMIRLCALEDIPDGDAGEFDVVLGGVRRYLFALRSGTRVFVYLDYCPHIGHPQEFIDERYFTAVPDVIYCNVHGAHFDPATGDCLIGPPFGDSLGRFESKTVDGIVYVGQTLRWPGLEPEPAMPDDAESASIGLDD